MEGRSWKSYVTLCEQERPRARDLVFQNREKIFDLDRPGAERDFQLPPREKILLPHVQHGTAKIKIKRRLLFPLALPDLALHLQHTNILVRLFFHLFPKIEEPP